MKKINQYFLSALASVALAAPATVALAAVTNFKDLINQTIIAGILRPLIPLLVGLAVVMFVYGVLIFMFSEGGEKKEEGKQYMLWGIIGIFVMVSVWGLVSILVGVFQLNVTPIPIRIGQ